jgi:hypothetical protein
VGSGQLQTHFSGMSGLWRGNPRKIGWAGRLDSNARGHLEGEGRDTARSRDLLMILVATGESTKAQIVRTLYFFGALYVTRYLDGQIAKRSKDVHDWERE